MGGTRIVVFYLHSKVDSVQIITEFCDGGALNDIMALARSPLNQEQIKHVMSCCLLGIAALHSAGFVHRVSIC